MTILKKINISQAVGKVRKPAIELTEAKAREALQRLAAQKAAYIPTAPSPALRKYDNAVKMLATAEIQKLSGQDKYCLTFNTGMQRAERMEFCHAVGLYSDAINFKLYEGAFQIQFGKDDFEKIEKWMKAADKSLNVKEVPAFEKPFVTGFGADVPEFGGNPRLRDLLSDKGDEPTSTSLWKGSLPPRR